MKIDKLEKLEKEIKDVEKQIEEQQFKSKKL